MSFQRNWSNTSEEREGNQNEKLILSSFSSLLKKGTAHAGGGSSIGPANPAAVNCIQLGGALSLSLRQRENANCVIEQWTLFHAMLSGASRDHNYGPGGMPNPAAVNCLDIAGTLRMIETPEGTAGYCVVNQWALFRVIDVVTRP
ncbi:MAG: DUF333 domain-containing protein [Bdellovibrionales bacterium]|nr:DUF333 domain-containing protein [Bdellovibrionales bacterium]